jgi:hypothetical protein
MQSKDVKFSILFSSTLLNKHFLYAFTELLWCIDGAID